MSEISIPELPKESSLISRVSHLVATSALPAGLVGLVSDFFGPRGGWMVAATLGAISLALFVLAFAYLSIRSPGGAAPRLYKLVTGKAELSWAWASRPPIASHGLHALLLFGALSLVSANKTYAEAAEGGYLGKNVDMVAAMQKSAGILQAQLNAQKETNRKLDEIKEVTGAAKREVSSDPRKELANMGVQWSDSDFEAAVQRRDIRALNLYAQAGFKVNGRNAWAANKAFKTGDENVMQAVTPSLATDKSKQDCTFLFYAIENLPPGSKTQRTLIKAACGSPEMVDMVKDWANRAEKQLNEEKEQLAKWNARTPRQVAEDNRAREDCASKGFSVWMCPGVAPRGNPKTTEEHLAKQRRVLSWLE